MRDGHQRGTSRDGVTEDGDVGAGMAAGGGAGSGTSAAVRWRSGMVARQCSGKVPMDHTLKFRWFLTRKIIREDHLSINLMEERA